MATVKFLHTYRDSIPPLQAEQDVSVNLRYFIACFSNDLNSAELIFTRSVENFDMSRRNISFLRALFHNDCFMLDGERQLALRLSALRIHSGSQTVAILDYTTGSPAVPVVGVVERERAADNHCDVFWDEHIARAARSGGRISRSSVTEIDNVKGLPVLGRKQYPLPVPDWMSPPQAAKWEIFLSIK
ncbi:hypothetical protein B0H19DRAFT_1064221 [Mycena capillaripes]|nr:hypothetical protein B0H19DRAFT_1064221 [Mycena capillaripes]